LRAVLVFGIASSRARCCVGIVALTNVLEPVISEGWSTIWLTYCSRLRQPSPVLLRSSGTISTPQERTRTEPSTPTAVWTPAVPKRRTVPSKRSATSPAHPHQSAEATAAGANVGRAHHLKPHRSAAIAGIQRARRAVRCSGSSSTSGFTSTDRSTRLVPHCVTLPNLAIVQHSSNALCEASCDASCSALI
jgi:hypothetical protein